LTGSPAAMRFDDIQLVRHFGKKRSPSRAKASFFERSADAAEYR